MESDGGRETIRPATAEEEAVKRNTDCVYFLASPLTCKKGTDCEYRHSEGARINPRDCWYWLNGNCLNQKCSFRHPPLDSLFASPVPNSGPLPPQSETTASTRNLAARGPNNVNKQSVPCYYFQWGQCLKGERCSFLHGPQTSVSSASQQQVKASIAEPQRTSKKDMKQQTTMTEDIAEINNGKPKASYNMSTSMTSVAAKFVAKYENAPSSRSPENQTLPHYSSNDQPAALPQNIVPVSSGYSQSQSWVHQAQHSDEQPENDRDNDEFLPEYSPGFDVLVENDVKDPDYYGNEDNFRRLSSHGGHVEPEDDYDYHQSDYEAMVMVERDRGNGIGKYDNYEQSHSKYGWESKTSGRILDKPSSLERRLVDRETRSDEMDGSDLRHRLKQRRTNGSRSTMTHDGRGEHYRRDRHYTEKRHYGHHSRGEKRLSPEKPLSTRLQGRIAFPGRTSVDTVGNLFLERERGRIHRGRLSPMQQINYQARHPERIRRQPSEEFNKDMGNLWNKPARREGTNSLDFAGPKSLAELKGTKNSEIFHEQSTNTTDCNTNFNKVKPGKPEGLHELENSVSFKGPVPLSVILERKRKSEFVDIEYSTDRYNNNQDGGESAINSHATELSLQSVPPLEAGKHDNHIIGSDEEEGIVPAEDEELDYDGRSPNKADAVETEDLENVEEDLENYNERDGHLDYVPGEYKADDDENAFPADEDDLDDEDDFARKVSDMLS